jgi:hypothetical protein
MELLIAIGVGMALLGVVLVVPLRLRHLSHARRERREQGPWSRNEKLSLASIAIGTAIDIAGLLGSGDGKSRRETNRRGSNPGDRDPTVFVDWSLAVPGGLHAVDQNILIHNKANSTGWIASWHWTDDGTGGGGFLGLQEGGHRFDGTVGGLAIFSIEHADNARGTPSHNCGKVDPKHGDYYSCRIPYGCSFYVNLKRL